MKQKELDHIENEYQKTFTFYREELKARREYLRWYTVFYSLIITITAFLWKFELKDISYLVLVLSLIVSIPVMNVLVGSSKTIIYLVERIAKIQTKINTEFPDTKDVIPKYTSNALTVQSKYKKIPFFKLHIGYVITIMMSFIAMCSSFLVGLLLTEINYKAVCFWTISLLIYILTFICLRIFAVISLGSFINKLKFNNHGNNDKKAKAKKESKSKKDRSKSS
jgi:hypothetical protein